MVETSKIVFENIIHKNKQWSQWLAVVSAALNLFICGICFSWSSPSLAILQGPDTPINITNDEASWIASLLPFGSALGPVVGSLGAKYLGPKQSILMSSVPYLVGFALIIFADSARFLYASRFVSGIAIGFGFTAVPIYIGEIAEDRNRGSLMIMITFMLGLGSTLATCVAPYVTIQHFASICCIFPLLLLSSFACMPDSPYYLMKIDKEEEATKALKWLRRQSRDDAVADELNTIRKTVESNVSFVDGFKEIAKKPNPKALFIIFTTILAQQCCGATAVTFYQEQIYANSGVPMDPEKAVILSQVVGAIFGIAVIFFVDRWGRRPLMILSCALSVLSTTMIGAFYQLTYVQETYPGFKWLPVIALNMLLVAFSLGLGPIPYTILGEMFSSNFKEVAVCIVSVGGAIASFAVAKLFQIINDEYGSSAVFYSLAGSTAFLTAIIVVVLPETMHKSFLEIQKILIGKSNSVAPMVEKYSQNNTCKA